MFTIIRTIFCAVLPFVLSQPLLTGSASPASGSHSFGFGHVFPIFLAGVHWPAGTNISKGWGGEGRRCSTWFTLFMGTHAAQPFQAACRHVPAFSIRPVHRTPKLVERVLPAVGLGWRLYHLPLTWGFSVELEHSFFYSQIEE